MNKLKENRRWCPILKQYFTGDDCPKFNKKCVNINPLECVEELKKASGGKNNV